MRDKVVVFITVPNKQSASKISDLLLDKQLVACVNIISDVESYFWWDKKIDKANELLLIAKSCADCLDDIAELVKQNHEYEVPEIIALPIVYADQEYMRWIEQSVKKRV